MEWTMPVNEMLHDEITKLNYTLIPPGYQGDVRSVRVMQESLSKIINQLGEQSAQAQGLTKVITTAEKLRNAPTHTLYLLKDAEAKGGAGEVIGLLKVGRKHLFLFDERDKVCEVEPLCVLDFFVVLDRQRHGNGRVLFDRMLQDAGVEPRELAVDGPSPKMEQFLTKNYGLERLLRQNNNFAVAPNFFDNVQDVRLSLRQILEIRKKRSEVAPPLHCKPESAGSAPAAAGRFTAPKPHSSIANVIHGGGGGGGGGFYHHDTSNGVPPAPVGEAPARPSSLRVAPPAPPAPPAAGLRSSAAPSPAGSGAPRRDSQLTDLGYFDVKYYHNKLW